MVKHRFFSYSWYVDDDEENITSIRVYGIDDKEKNICLRIDDFTPYIYIELPSNIDWTASKAQIVGDKIDDILKDKKPLKKCLVMKKKLYGAHLTPNKKRKQFPFLFCSFSNKSDAKNLSWKLKSDINVQGFGRIRLKIHEQDANEVLQLVCCKDIPTAGWIEFKGDKVEEIEKITRCDLEYKVSYKNLKKVELDTVARVKLMGYDIEVNSSNPSAMPDARKPNDKVFQISCIFARIGDTKYKEYLLTLGDPDPKIVGENVIIRRFGNSSRNQGGEADLLQGFTDLINEENPNVISGYNIFTFDIPYMIARAKFNMCIFNFDKQGFHKFAHAKETTISWSSSAYKNQEFEYLDAEGRLFVDLLPLIKRDFKLNKFDLKTVSTHFLGETKDPLSVQGIFKCYRIGIKKEEDGTYSKMARKAMGIVGKYCVQDTALVVRLFDLLKTWVGLCEMAKTCVVPIFTLYTQGQQIKVYSQAYKYCTYNNIVVEKDGYVTQDNERYVGAHVFPPVPGLYNRVLPFDFASLYPTIIIAYNIDYFTWVTDPKIPDSDCHVMKWEDHIGCCHDPKMIRKKKLTDYIDKVKADIKAVREKRNKTLDKFTKAELMKKIKVMLEGLKPYTKERSDINKSKPKHNMCDKRYFRFLKEPRGVIPTILQNLLDARMNTRKEIKVHKKTISEEKEKKKPDKQKITELELLMDVLDKRQKSYKISCNSMYGAMGVRRGYLPFMPGAMCTTYMGRINNIKVSEVIAKKFKGDLIYGDSVSGDTPIMVKGESGDIDVVTIESLGKEWGDYNQFKAGESNRKEKQQSLTDNRVWSNGKWTKIIRVIRHKTVKKMYRILTEKGCIDVTEDHSLLGENLEKLKPGDISIGDKLLHSFPPELLGLKRENLSLVGEIEAPWKYQNKVEAQKCYMRLKEYGSFKVSITMLDNEYCIHTTKDPQSNSIKKIIELPPTTEDEYVYDLETEEGVFHAGIGELIVKNTDSCYFHFPHLKTAEESWDYGLHVASEVTKIFPAPIELVGNRWLHLKLA